MGFHQQLYINDDHKTLKLYKHKYTNLRKHEKRDPFASDGAGEDDEEGEDVGDQEHQLLETFHPFLGGLRSRIDFWRLNL
jgi:hypothetical protein